jgi:hypothetical protein
MTRAWAMAGVFAGAFGWGLVRAPVAEAQAPVVPCELDLDCDDGLFCNGAERCRPGAPGSDARGCLVPTPPQVCLAHQKCNEQLERCEETCAKNPDADGDGHMRLECPGGDDCDDWDPGRFPGLPEVCDPAGKDEDCNPLTTGHKDDDRDGFSDIVCRNVVKVSADRPTRSLPALTKAAELVFYGGTDCDDKNPLVGPNTQICDGTGVKVCSPVTVARNVKIPLDARFSFQWRRFGCGASQSCVAQPNGSGVCVGPPGPPGQPLPPPKPKPF